MIIFGIKYKENAQNCQKELKKGHFRTEKVLLMYLSQTPGIYFEVFLVKVVNIVKDSVYDTPV